MLKPFDTKTFTPLNSQQKKMFGKHCHLCGIKLPILSREYFCPICKAIVKKERDTKRNKHKIAS